MKEIMNCMPVGMVVTDKANKLHFLNEEVKQMFQMKEEKDEAIIDIIHKMSNKVRKDVKILT